MISDERGGRYHLNTSQPILLPLEKSPVLSPLLSQISLTSYIRHSAEEGGIKHAQQQQVYSAERRLLEKKKKPKTTVAASIPT